MKLRPFFDARTAGLFAGGAEAELRVQWNLYYAAKGYPFRQDIKEDVLRSYLISKDPDDWLRYIHRANP